MSHKFVREQVQQEVLEILKEIVAQNSRIVATLCTNRGIYNASEEEPEE